MAARSTQTTLTANTVATVTLTPSGRVTMVRVSNIDNPAAVTYTLDGTDPTVGGDEMKYLPAAIGSRESDYAGGDTPTVTVKLISAGTPTVAVEVE